MGDRALKIIKDNPDQKKNDKIQLKSNPAKLKTQYWVLSETTGSLKEHVYKIGKKFFQVVAYCDEIKYAYGFCGTSGKKVVFEVQISDYDESMRMAHKKNFTVISRHIPIMKQIHIK